jgi:phosphatidylserine decarboxylase
MKNSNVSLSDYLKSAAVYVLPHHFISRLIYKATRIKSSYVPAAIRKFSKVFKVDLEEAINPDPNSYATFNEFFTRPIKPELRPIATGATTLASPVDGAISQIKPIDNDSIFQAKGHSFSATELLGGDKKIAQPFLNGKFTTIYLSPRDYHRIHMPIAGNLEQQIYIPGRLYSVAPFTVKTVKGIFARNERVVTLFNTEFGKMAVVLVGAINVAAIETVWDGLITPPAGKSIKRKSYHTETISLKKGEELGRFNMGSTVILLFENNKLEWNAHFSESSPIKMGENLGQFSI